MALQLSAYRAVLTAPMRLARYARSTPLPSPSIHLSPFHSRASTSTAPQISLPFALQVRTLATRPASGPRSSPAKPKSTAPAAPASSTTATSARKRLPKDPHFMSQRVLKLTRQGKFDEAITFVKEAPMSLQNEVVWNHLIDEAGRIGKTNLALKLMNDMKKRGHEPTERTYTIVLKALARNPSSPETVARAQDLYEHMQTRGIDPNLHHTNALLKVLGRAGDLDAMHRLFTSMPRQGPNAPDTITFNTVLGAYGQPPPPQQQQNQQKSTSSSTAEAADQAWQVWDACLQAKIERPEAIDLDERLLGSLMVAVRHSPRRSKDGLQVVESLYGVQLLPRSQAQQEKEETRVQNLEYIRSKRTTYPGEALGLGPLLARSSDNGKAMPSFRTMDLVLQLAATAKEPKAGQAFIEWVQSTHGDAFVPDMPLLTTLTGSYVKSRQFDKALECLNLYHQHRIPEPSVLFFQHIMEALRDSRDRTTRALDLVREMVDLTRNGALLRKDGRPAHGMDPIALASYGQICKREGQWKDGLQVLDEVQWQKVIERSDHSKANHGVAQWAIYVLRETLKDLKKTLRRDDFVKQQLHEVGEGTEGSAAQLMTKSERKELQAQIDRREEELDRALELEKEWGKQREEKGRQTRDTYKGRKRAGQ
ncbi:hypothetical protein BGW41_007489 [Actinomortierella wolfii]|nr:hypothetical protein BGW41_007489 [Actinomortierella wolfii]